MDAWTTTHHNHSLFNIFGAKTDNNSTYKSTGFNSYMKYFEILPKTKYWNVITIIQYLILSIVYRNAY